MANMTSSVSASQVAGELASATFEEIPALVEHYRVDPRQQVIKACERALKRHAKELAERERVNDMYELMHELGGDGVVVGVDEVGRGSVAGPLTVCAVCLPMEPRIWGINDSKKLTPARRELLSVKIAEVATAIGFCHIAPADIDEMGMARAIRAAVAGAVADTGLEPDCVLMDGNPLGAVPNERDVVKGDAKIACIAAASIMAKVTRDEMMVEYDAEYPEYHLAESKGYASPEHIEAIRKHGLCPLHRVSFCDEKGNVCFASNDYLAQYTEKGEWKHLFPNAKDYYPAINAAAYDKRGRLWVAPNNSDTILAVIENADTTVFKRDNTPFQTGQLKQLEFDSKNHLWVGASNGLYKYDGGFPIAKSNFISSTFLHAFVRQRLITAPVIDPAVHVFHKAMDQLCT